MSFLTSRIDRQTKSLLWLFYVLILVRNAWLCEDAYITYRVVDNLTHGYGPRWNTLERVQVYTHPLWMLLLSALRFVSRDMYFSAIALSLVCSAATVWLLLSRVMTSTAQCLVAIVLVTFSKAFVDFSTSGLENPLSHLLLVLFFVEYLKPEGTRSFRKMIRWVALILVTRMDLVWLLLPALAHVTWAGGYWRPRQWRVWLQLWPFIAWEAFSLLYYGSFFPNSAYAKLMVHLPTRVFVAQGFSYFLNSLAWDPLTLFAMAALVIVGIHLAKRQRQREPAMLSLGILLHVAYVVRVGGDYMSGRFLAAPFLVSVLILSGIHFETLVQFCTALGVALALGISGPRPPILMRDEYVGLGSAPQSVDDERGYRHETALLLRNRSTQIADLGGWVADGIKARREHPRVIVYKNIGYFGFFAGPDVHIIDPYGIGDALMARMRFDSSMRWGPGHFYRTVPEGYPEAATGEGRIKDMAIDEYWNKVKLVTRGPLFDPARLAMIARFNLGLEPPP
jgi:arabinofuranosyltransferase